MMGLDNFPSNIWYVAAWSHEVSDISVLERTILGTNLILYRKSDGSIAAMRNRCPHRSAPLSAGRREGDAIRCGYHGMLFGSDGRCLSIPGSEHVPPNADVRSYPTIERNGWIWLWPGDAKMADPTLIPDLSTFEQPDWKWKTGYIGYQAGAQLLHDNLLDFSHLEFVHERTLGGGANWADKPEISKIPTGLHIERWMTNVEPAPFLRKIIPEGIRHDILNIYDFVLPGVLVIDTIAQETGSGTRLRPDPTKSLRLVSQQAVTPATDESSHYFFSAISPGQVT